MPLSALVLDFVQYFTKSPAALWFNFLSISSHYDAFSIIISILKMPDVTKVTLLGSVPSNTERWGGLPVKFFHPAWICNSICAGSSLHPGIALERFTVIDGEDKNDVPRILEGIREEFHIGFLGCPDAALDCVVNVVIIPGFDNEEPRT